MKIAVLGSSGMAGHMITRYFWREGIDIDNYARQKVFKDTKKLDIDALDIHFAKYDYVINCTGILVKGSNLDPVEAIKVNSLLPYTLRAYSNYGFKLIHLSTDCVFSGQNTPSNGYAVTDPTNAITFYGKTKALGEVGTPAQTIRTSIIGPEIVPRINLGLLEWFISQTSCHGYTNALWAGITTLELAKFIGYIVTSNPDIPDLVQVTNGIPISKFNLLHIINDVYKLGIEITPSPYIKDNKSLQQDPFLAYNVPSYTQMIQEMYEFK